MLFGTLIFHLHACWFSFLYVWRRMIAKKILSAYFRVVTFNIRLRYTVVFLPVALVYVLIGRS